jgi:hypothetical protein
MPTFSEQVDELRADLAAPTRAATARAETDGNATEPLGAVTLAALGAIT